MQMNGINGLITIAKYYRQWQDPRLVVMVLNNRDLNQVTWEQRAMSGDPKFEGSQEVPMFPYARYAAMLGLKGILVQSPDDVGRAWDEAFASDRPVVLEAITDPNVPTLPPHITIEQARNFAAAVWHGDPDTLGFVKQTAKEAADSVFPPAAKNGKNGSRKR
jgi:pyruvate dehydrogenase (quinone)